jgi:hypothetical protein
MSLEFDITANISKMQASLNKAQAKLNDFAKIPDRSPPTPPTSRDMPSKIAIMFM